MKECIICHVEKKEIDFALKSKESGIRYSHCKQCQSGFSKKHYAENKQKYFERDKRKRSANKEWLKVYKQTLCCERCGYNTCPEAIEFHHRDPSVKDSAISSLMRFRSIEHLKEEIAKCEVLCANCHREHHYKK